MNDHRTPLPWKVNDINPDAVHSAITRQRVAVCKPSGCVCHTEQDRDNAEFIVRACNNHESLLEALRMAAKWADPYDFPPEVLKAMSKAIQQATQT